MPQVPTAVVAHWLATTGAEPAGTLVQVPALVVRAHDWQVPLQALLQQTPCWQKPEAHSAAVEQLVPGVFRAQAPAMHTSGATQSASAVHVVLQAVPPLAQVKFPGQAPAVTGRQVPAPSHVWAGASVEPLQLGATHCVPVG